MNVSSCPCNILIVWDRSFFIPTGSESGRHACSGVFDITENFVLLIKNPGPDREKGEER